MEAVKPVSSFLGFFGKLFFEKKSLQRKSDLENYHLLKSKLPPFDEIKFYFRENNFMGSFSSSFLLEFCDGIEKFSDNPENRFHDKTLQRHIIETRRLALTMWDLAMRKCRKTNDDRYDYEIRCRKYGDPEDDLETGEQLNYLSARIFQNFSNFIRLAKNKLIATNQGPLS